MDHHNTDYAQAMSNVKHRVAGRTAKDASDVLLTTVAAVALRDNPESGRDVLARETVLVICTPTEATQVRPNDGITESLPSREAAFFGGCIIRAE